MRYLRAGVVYIVLAVFVSLAGAFRVASAEDSGSLKGGKQETGYASKKPIFGGACVTCPWGSIAEIVKKAIQFYGYDIQICYVCAGGPREARGPVPPGSGCSTRE